MKALKDLRATLGGLWSLVVGLRVTGKNFLGRTQTTHFPRQVVPNLDTFRGHIDLVAKDENPDEPRCILCMLCASICPSGCISISPLKEKPTASEAGAEEKEGAKPEAKVEAKVVQAEADAKEAAREAAKARAAARAAAKAAGEPAATSSVPVAPVPPVPKEGGEPEAQAVAGMGVVVPKKAAPPKKGGKRVGEFNYNYNTCSLCGLCVQNCPVDSLMFSRDVYQASFTSKDYEYDLLARMRERENRLKLHLVPDKASGVATVSQGKGAKGRAAGGEGTPQGAVPAADSARKGEQESAAKAPDKPAGASADKPADKPVDERVDKAALDKADTSAKEDGAS